MSKIESFKSKLNELNKYLSEADKYKDYLSPEQKVILKEKLIGAKVIIDNYRKRLELGGK